RQPGERRQHRRLPESSRLDAGSGTGVRRFAPDGRGRPSLHCPYQAGWTKSSPPVFIRTQAEFAMTTRPAMDSSIDAQWLFEGFETLMPFRVRDILLVSSLYDSFILKEDGRLNELLVGESVEMNLQQIPSITQVSTGAEALARWQPRFNLVVTNLEVGDMDAAELAREIKASGMDIPVVVLAYDYRELKNFVARNQHRDIERVFLWQGNVRMLIAIVKLI